MVGWRVYDLKLRLSNKFYNGYTAGGYGGKTDLMTGNLNLSTAYRLNEHFSVDVGFDAVYAKAKIERPVSLARCCVFRPILRCRT